MLTANLLNCLAGGISPDELCDVIDEINSITPTELTCDRCGKSAILLTMSPLPEVEEYCNALRDHLTGKGPKPELQPDEYFRYKYGYDASARFCLDCIATISGMFAEN